MVITGMRMVTARDTQEPEMGDTPEPVATPTQPNNMDLRVRLHSPVSQLDSHSSSPKPPEAIPDILP
jgi:hypothetical protein